MKSQFDVAVESTKTSLLLLIFALINTYKSFENPKIIAAFIKANLNICIYKYLTKYCNYTRKWKILF